MKPPFLGVRPGLAFWVETCAPDECSATVQAFADFVGSRWHDTRITPAELWRHMENARSIQDVVAIVSRV